MTRGKLAILAALSLLGLLAAGVRALRAADKPVCEVKVMSFTNVAFKTRPTLSYQFRLVVKVTASPSLDLYGGGNFSGVSNEGGLTARPALVRGKNVYNFWFIPDVGVPNQHYEKVDFFLGCDTTGGRSLPGDDDPAKARVYRPSEAQPVIQP